MEEGQYTPPIFIIAVAVLLIIGAILLWKQIQESPTDKTERSEETGQLEDTEKQQEEIMSTYIDINPEAARNLIEDNPDLIIIDVSPKYEEGHIPGAVNYYIGDGTLDEAIPDLEPEATYLIYCHTDSASIAGAQKLIDAGFKNVYRLEGNYQAWIDAGYDIEM